MCRTFPVEDALDRCEVEDGGVCRHDFFDVVGNEYQIRSGEVVPVDFVYTDSLSHVSQYMDVPWLSFGVLLFKR